MTLSQYEVTPLLAITKQLGVKLDLQMFLQ